MSAFAWTERADGTVAIVDTVDVCDDEQVAVAFPNPVRLSVGDKLVVVATVPWPREW